MRKLFLIFCMMLGLISCDQPVGKSSDVIKFSKTKLSFDAQGGTETITSVGNGWWINGFSAENDKYVLDFEEGILYLYGQTEGGEYEKLDDAVTYNPNDIWDIINIKGPWFAINKETSQKITFSVLPNDTGKERTLSVGIQCGNYFTEINLIQAAN